MSISAKKRPYSESNREANSKIVIDLSTGVFFSSCLQAANCYGFKYSTLKAKLTGQNKNNTNLSYV